MARKLPQLAKLARPRLHKAVPRERLFKLLDEARQYKPGICVVGPPGAGKTTLVASWLDARSIEGIWYQVDPGDADLATFFYYLGEAAKPFTRKGQRPLPLLTPEYLHDVGGFSRRFFREIFSRLPEGSALVLDNYQEVAPEQRFHPLIAEAVDEVPAGMTLVSVSRRDPPDCYARLVANENVLFVDWDDLKLSLEEARAIAGNRASLPEVDIKLMHEQSGGWAAGLTLMLEGRKDETGGQVLLAGRDAIFDYFAQQIFQRVPTETQRFLVATAFLPQVRCSFARELTGNADTADILEGLYRRHLFTHRRPGGESVYWYHALFRDFLKARARAVLNREEHQAAILRAAILLEEHAAFDDAFHLYVEAGDWQKAECVVLGQASRLLDLGRGQTLRDWILALPAHRQNDQPWLLYWLGASLIQVNQIDARRHLEHCFSRFSALHDIAAQMRAVSNIIYTYFFEWAQWRGMDPWIDVLEALIRATNTYPSVEIEFDVNCSMLIATLYRRPGHGRLSACADRVEAMLESDLDVNRKVTGATLLLTFCNLTNKPERARRTIIRTEKLIGQPEVTPLNQIWWYCRLTWYLNANGYFSEVAKYIHAANQLNEAHGLLGLRSAIQITSAHWAWAMMGLKEWKEASKLVDELEARSQSSRSSDLVLAAESRARLLMCRGEPVRALHYAGIAIEAAVATGMIWWEVLQRASALEALAELGRHEEARTHLRRCYELVRATSLSYWETELSVIEAYMARQQGNVATCHELLKSAFTRADGQWRNGRLYARVLTSMCAEALDASIEVARVQAVIRRLRLNPPSLECRNWPWAVQVFALGRFEVYREGERLEFAGKAPKKLLALLKALVALGGRSVPEERLMDALWPDEEADAARKSLDITVLRLRKLLGSPEAIVVSDEAIGLSPQLCWTDVWAFEHRAGADEERANLGADMLGLYGGNFLPDDTDAPWTAKTRERLRSKFVRLTETVSRDEERVGRWDQAIALYSKGLEADDLVEAFYQGLMRCYRAQGRHAEAMNTYRRLRHLLSVVLGIAPSEATESLARLLQRDNAAQFESTLRRVHGRASSVDHK